MYLFLHELYPDDSHIIPSRSINGIGLIVMRRSIDGFAHVLMPRT